MAEPVSPAAGQPVSLPEIPSQGPGPYFVVRDDGKVDFAPPEALDREGNNIALLRVLHPEICDLAKTLCEQLNRGNVPHSNLRERAESYRTLVDRDLKAVPLDRLYIEGVRLQNATTAARQKIAEKELPSLEAQTSEALESLLELHGTFILSTAVGLELIGIEERYKRHPQDEAKLRSDLLAFAEHLKSRPDIVEEKTADFVLKSAQEMSSGENLERSAVVATGTVKNAAIVVVSAATIAALPLIGGAIIGAPGVVTGGVAVLVGFDAIRKSKSFQAIVNSVTKRLDHLTDVDLEELVANRACALAPYIKFVLKIEPTLRRLGLSNQFQWLNASLDWLKMRTADDSNVSVEENAAAASTEDRIELSAQLPEYALRDRFRDFDPGSDMIVVPAGRFLMGSPDGKGEAGERPQHGVIIKRSFGVSISPVTRAEFERFVVATRHEIEPGAYVWSNQEWTYDLKASWREPGFEQEDDHPVVCVNWYDAHSYVGWLRERSHGKIFRLLSEAEWEYCCRAGTVSDYSTGDTITTMQANFALNSRGTTSALKFPPNAWGLRDMHGNVLEWCEDNWHDDYAGHPPSDGSAWAGGDTSFRVLRGGSWLNIPKHLRSAYRTRDFPDVRSSRFGFRIARTL
jgi:formylglycine-generating enzyme required for sulfatase activity